MTLKGGSDEQRTIFYTALWHALLMPRIFSDADGTYIGFAGEGREHKADGFDYYCDFSLWDTFRAQHPLLILLEPPKRVSDMVRSLVAKNNSDANRYIQSARLNARSWNKPWIPHEEIARGGSLEFVMGPKPNPRWGADPLAAPPSMRTPATP